MNKKN